VSEPTQGPTELDGVWRPVLLEWQGRLGPAPEGAALLRIVGGQFSVTRGNYVYASGRVRVDLAARPRRVDFLQPLGPDWWAVQAGIYEVTGDELRLRLADGEVPPEGFDGERGFGVYRRERGEGP
jgi:uncharacterized protein (TIGR03067 family)